MAQSSNLTTCCICGASSIECLTLSCESGHHSSCLPCIKLCFHSHLTTEQLEEGFRCPVGDCGSHFDCNLLREVLTESSDEAKNVNWDKISVRVALGSTPLYSCPGCQYLYASENDTFEDLFFHCVQCKRHFCLTCEHALQETEYKTHRCPHGVNVTELRRRLEEELSKATIVVCPNERCRFTKTGIRSHKKDGLQSNLMQCELCTEFFCFICNKHLGLDCKRAEAAFPHRNKSISRAPKCWLVSEENSISRRDEEALFLRKLHCVSKYFSSLKMTSRQKNFLIGQCQDLLGDLGEYFVQQTNRGKDAKDCSIS